MNRVVAAIAVLLVLVSCVERATRESVSIIPMPSSVEQHGGSYVIDPGATIAADTSLRLVADYLVRVIKASSDLRLVVTDLENGEIRLLTSLSSDNREAYELTVDDHGVTINGASAVGLIRGISTLAQLLPSNAADGAVIPQVQIKDSPRFGYRGMMLDVSRHFQDVDGVKHVLDMMARYKLNKFHWHLTDDQGWRIEIKQYPDLTAKGAWRKWNNHDRMCMDYQVQYDNHDFVIPTKYLKIDGADTLYGGFYTQDQIHEVVAYAAQRGIDVIPELDMPGHLMAAIEGYPWISCNGKAQWGKGFSEPLCIGNDEAIEFVKNIYTEVAGLFPYEYMHLGADEVERVTWSKCPKCMARIKSEGLTGVDQLQAWFVHDMESHFDSLGKKMIGWDEIMEGGLSPAATIMWWRDWAPKAVSEATAKGNNVIMAPCFSMYLDAWESSDTFEKCYAFEPVAGELSAAQASHVLGVQGNLWCETIPSMRRIEYQIFPRLLAVAEIGWSADSKKDWEGFQKRYVTEMDWFDAHGVNYRIPNITGFADVNVFTDTTSVAVKCALPNIQVRYTTDGSMPTVVSPPLSSPLHLSASTKFIFRGFRPDGTAGECFKSEYRKEDFAAPVADFTPTADGMLVKHYDYKGVYNQKQCDRIEDGHFSRQYVLDSLNLSKEIKGFMGLVAVGYINIPSDGIYTFALKSNDGSTMSIDDAMLIDNDNTHGDKQMVAQKALAKGWHKIEVRFFDLDNGGMLRLTINGEVIRNFKH